MLIFWELTLPRSMAAITFYAGRNGITVDWSERKFLQFYSVVYSILDQKLRKYIKFRLKGSQRRSWDITFEPKLKATTGGCGAVVKNQLFIFGGSKNTVQHVVGCRSQIGTPMPFVFNNGICASVDGGEKYVLH